MSFDKITKDFVARKKAIQIEAAGQTFTFYANELSFLDNVQIGTKREQGENWLLHLIVASITDEKGNRMTVEQAQKLSDVHAKIFMDAIAEVSEVPGEKK